MAKSSLSDLLGKLSLTSEQEDSINFYLTTLRRRGKFAYISSKTALFLPDLEKSGWIYLELGKINGVFVWGCSLCENMETFREKI